jgi:hypothetical protein
MLKVEKLSPREAWVTKGADCYVVRRGVEIVGLLEKYRGKLHPWKAFAGVGETSRFLGSTYDGRAAAIGMIEREVAA